ASSDSSDVIAMPASTSARRRFSLALTAVTRSAYPGGPQAQGSRVPPSRSLVRAQPQNRCPTPVLGKPRTHQVADGCVQKQAAGPRLRARRPSLGLVARPLRALYEGIYHLAARGSDERFLFVVDSDREDFLDRLAAICERFELALLSYVLMGSHYHALIRIRD